MWTSYLLVISLSIKWNREKQTKARKEQYYMFEQYLVRSITVNIHYIYIYGDISK